MRLSEHIRAKKKEMKDKLPEVVDNSPMEMNALDVWNNEKKAYVEEMVRSPEKSSSEDDELSNESPLEIQDKNKARAARLRKMMDEKDF
jgi:hypothetical protein